ncbi:MAG TPA: hypothetical protein VHB21_20330 [Minicystis sp.]|nr:hypothetical protein [Minicystis sp.]
MAASRRTAVVFALAGGALAAVAAAGPAGCFFPDYTFDRNPSGGGGTGPGPSSSHGSGGGTSTSSSSRGASSSTGTGGAGGTGGMGGMAGTGGMGGATSSSSSSSSTGGGGPVCANGGGKCVADVPNGWTGYFALYDGAPGADPGCPANYPSNMTAPYLGQGDFSANPATCSCTCGAPTGEKCNYPSEVDVLDAPCATAMCGSQLPLPANWNGSCTGMEYAGGNTCNDNSPTCMGTSPCSISITSPPATVDESGGSCAPDPVHVTKPMVTFGTLGRGCGDPQPIQGTCNAGQTCVPAPPAPYVAGVCIMQTGDVQCPPVFTQKHVFYEGFDDTRNCSGACACPDPPTGATCSATITVYSDLTIGACNTQVISFQAGACVSLTGNPNVAGRKGTKTAPTGGSCTADASAVMPSGTATPNQPTTFCCVP